jgi:hypothetical protein
LKSKTVAKNENEKTISTNRVTVPLCCCENMRATRLYVFPLSAWCTGAGDDAQTLDEFALRLSAKEREILPLQAELAHLLIHRCRCFCCRRRCCCCSRLHLHKRFLFPLLPLSHSTHAAAHRSICSSFVQPFDAFVRACGAQLLSPYSLLPLLFPYSRFSSPSFPLFS